MSSFSSQIDQDSFDFICETCKIYLHKKQSDAAPGLQICSYLNCCDKLKYDNLNRRMEQTRKRNNNQCIHSPDPLPHFGHSRFTSVELPGEKKQLLEIKRNMEQHAVELTGTLVNSTIEQLCNLQNISDCHAAINYTVMEQKTFDLMNDMLHSLDVHEFAADPHTDPVNPHWGYTGAFHFCVTTITTIGNRTSTGKEIL